MFSDWTSADYFSNIASLVLFVIAYWLGRRQGQIIERVNETTEKEAEVIDQVSSLTTVVHRLQTAIAALQIREKIGVMKQRAVEVDNNPSAAITLLTDSISVLDVYRFAPEKLRRDYVETLDTAFTALCNRSSPNGKPMPLELSLELVQHAKSLFDQGERELAFSLIIPIASCALSLHQTGQIPTAGDFRFVTVELNTKARDVLAQLLSLNETDLLRKLETELFPARAWEHRRTC